MVATTKKQSKKLLELGIDPSTADMYYGYDYISPIGGYEEDAQIIPQSEFNEHFVLFPEDIPSWSLSTLLKLMPIINGDTYKLYGTLDGGCICEHSCTSVMFQEENAIDAVFEMIVWLRENKHIYYDSNNN